MLKLTVLTLISGLLLLGVSCGGEQGQNIQNKTSTQNLNQGQKQSNTTASSNENLNTNTNSTPPAASPSPAQTAPMTATVKNAGVKWKDEASGTPVTTIKVGGTVTWTITSGLHSIEKMAGEGCDELEDSFDSDNLGVGKSVTRTFTKAGTFGYHCGIHLGNPNCKAPPGTGAMPGVIKVVP